MDEFETIGDDLSGTVEELLNGEPTVIRQNENVHHYIYPWTTRAIRLQQWPKSLALIYIF